MPSRSNPNTPSALKRKTARTLKSKRQHTQQRLAHNKITKPTPHTSQALRRAAPKSKKKARKVEKKLRYARKRAMEAAGEVEMKDADELSSGRRADQKAEPEGAQARMEFDEMDLNVDAE